MKKIVVLLALLLCFTQSVFAKPFKNPIEKVLDEYNVNKDAISIKFVEVSNPKKSYSINPDRPLQPASTQKVITMMPAFEQLGDDYEFTTRLYRNPQCNTLYLQLGADPYLKTGDLKYLLKKAKGLGIKNLKGFYVDNTIVDGTEWGEGWQWDDELNPYIPKYSAYNIDGNLVKINVIPMKKSAPAIVETDVFYPITFINNVVTGDETNVTMSRQNYISPNMIQVDGTVREPYSAFVPTDYPKRYFDFRIEELLRELKLTYYGGFSNVKIPHDAVLVAEVKHSVGQAKVDVFKNSNNLVAETVFKLAGGNFKKMRGSTPYGILMFRDYCKKNGINYTPIKTVDASGVSKNNLVTANFMTDFLVKSSQGKGFEEYKQLLPTAGEGTMTDRMLYLKNKMWIKTGTLADISSLTGFIETEKGHVWAFSIMNNNPMMSNKDKKNLEEYILREVYSKL